MAKKGDWVTIRSRVLDPEERAPQVPEDTKKVPLELWVKGYLEEDAEIGGKAAVTTVTGRKSMGELVEIDPTYDHSFGDHIPEIRQIDEDLRRALFGGDES